MEEGYLPCYKPYVIKKGKHYSKLKKGIRFPKFNFGKQSFRIEVVFMPECSHLPFNDEDDYDINKLYGFSWGMHHTNSYRIGWRSDGKGGIILSNYYYVDGKRKYEDICTVPTNRNVTIDFEKGHVCVNTLQDRWTSKVALNMRTGWGYYLYPYFGGNKTAPDTMEILLKEVR